MKMIPEIIAECLEHSPEFREYFICISEEFEKISIEIKENPRRNRCHKISEGIYEIEVMDRTPYLVAHELEHCFIFEGNLPEVHIDREFFAMLLGQSKTQILGKLSMIAENINSLVYDPIIDRKLESVGFNMQKVHGFLLTAHAPMEHLDNQDGLSRKASILYFSLKKYLLEIYFNSDSWIFIEEYCHYPDICEKSKELIDCLKKCQYRNSLDIENLFINIINILDLKYRIQGNIISISLSDEWQ